MSQRRYEYMFDAICQKLKLNPSRWIPHIKTQGIYEMGTCYDSAEEMLDQDGELGKGTPIPIECFSLYGAFQTICRERAKQRLGLDDKSWMKAKLGFWYEFWGFLAELDMGVYDTTNWVAVDRSELDNVEGRG